jgi:butyryl-CoA dehydrogenase
MDFALSAEQDAFLAVVRAFARDRVAPAAAAIDESGEYPRALVAEAAALGLMGVTIPKAAGGAGRDYVTYALSMEAISQASATLAVILSVNNSLVAEPILEHGSPAQRERWLRPLASGDVIGAFALSEANAGSDAANQEATARPDGDGYLISGTKVWVANAEVAEVAIVFASTDAAARSRGVSAFLIPLASKGITRGRRQDSLGVRGLGCMDLVFDNVKVGADSCLGEVGRGFRLAMRALEGGRIAIAAQALGIGQAALEEGARVLAAAARVRTADRQFPDDSVSARGSRDGSRSGAHANLARGKPHDHVDRVACEAAMAKLHASEAAHRAADRAMQILASEGYRRGSAVERLFRDVRAAEIYQGTSEVQRMVIAEHVMDRRR